MRRRYLVFVLLVSTLLLSETALASPVEINCSSNDTRNVAVVNCSNMSKTLVEPIKVNVQMPLIIRSVKGSSRSENRSISDDVQELINWAAEKVGISSKLLGAVARTESSGNQSARSSVGAIGIMQLMPQTAKSLGVNPYNPKENILGGATYLKQQIDRYQGSLPKALAAYNAGPGAVDKYNGVPPYRETQDYVYSIMASLR